MIPYSLWNLAAWSGEALAIVAVAALMLRLVHVPRAWIRLAFWQLVVVACLALPWLPRTTVPLSSSAEGTVSTFEVLAGAAGIDAAFIEAAGMSAAQAVALAILAGVCLRAVWLLVGLMRLRRLRREGRPAPVDDGIEVLRRGLAPRVELRVHDTVGQPVTFGWRHPVILLPPAVDALESGARRAVICHELLHAARGDWAWRVVEELVCCACWFHPAVRWAVSQVQLSREEAVDEQVVAITSGRRPYMKALIDFATVPGAVAAVPFVARRHLTSRIVRLTEEKTMTRRRLAISGLVLAAALVTAASMAAYVVPLEVPEAAGALSAAEHRSPVAEPLGRPARSALADAVPPAGQDADEPLKVGGDIRPPRKIHNVNPVYPEDAKAAGVQGVVIMRTILNREGYVREVKVVRSIPELDDAATDAVWQWIYEPTLMNGAPVEVEMVVTVNFTLQQ